MAAVSSKVAEVKDIMVQNIEKVLDRGEKIDMLVDRTAQLNMTAQRFQKNARDVRRTMWWRNVKVWALIVLIAAFVIWAISAWACGIDYSKC